MDRRRNWLWGLSLGCAAALPAWAVEASDTQPTEAIPPADIGLDLMPELTDQPAG